MASYGNPIFPLCVNRCNQEGHVTGSRQVKMVHYFWNEEITEYLLQVIEVKIQQPLLFLTANNFDLTRIMS